MKKRGKVAKAKRSVSHSKKVQECECCGRSPSNKSKESKVKKLIRLSKTRKVKKKAKAKKKR